MVLSVGVMRRGEAQSTFPLKNKVACVQLQHAALDGGLVCLRDVFFECATVMSAY